MKKLEIRSWVWPAVAMVGAVVTGYGADVNLGIIMIPGLIIMVIAAVATVRNM